jgi:mono/diheme cytochrome c family protein
MKILACFAVLLFLVFSLQSMGEESAGQAAFDKACKACHGPNGEGNPKIAQMMKVTMRPLGSKEVQAKSDAEFKKIITEGSGKMKPVTRLTPKEVDEVVAFLRTLAKQ